MAQPTKTNSSPDPHDRQPVAGSDPRSAIPEAHASVRQQVRAHTNRPHKGDVGRPGTNEEVFQGSKMKELE